MNAFFIREAIDELNQHIKVVEADNGSDLLNLLNSQNLELFRVVVLLDLNMPKVNGLEAVMAIRSNDYTRLIPTAMISSCTDPLIIKQSYDAGINVFIKKPTNSEGFKKIAAELNVCFFN